MTVFVWYITNTMNVLFKTLQYKGCYLQEDADVEKGIAFSRTVQCETVCLQIHKKINFCYHQFSVSS